MSKISELSDGGVIQGGDTLIAVRSGGNVKVTYGGSTTANIDGGTIDGTTIGGTTPAAGNFTTGSFTGNVSFGDNDKAIFGASSDLQIYHNGATGLLQNNTGSLFLTNYADDYDVVIQSDDSLGGVADYFRADGSSGSAILYNYGSAKLATTTTGIDVTGTVTADGLTVDGDVLVNRTSAFTNAAIEVQDSGSGEVLALNNNGTDGQFLRLYNSGTLIGGLGNNSSEVSSFNIYRGSTRAISIGNATGDISFYEDTGTTAKLFWDASAESLGIGTSSPSRKLDVRTGSFNSAIAQFTGANDGRGLLISTFQRASNDDSVDYDTPFGGHHTFSSSGSEKVRITNTGNLIMTAGGTIRAGGVNDLILDAGESGTPDVYLQSGGSTKVKIEGSNGNVGIGTTSPSSVLHAVGSTGIILGAASGDTWQTAAIKPIDEGAQYKGTLAFYTHALAGSAGSPTERMRIDSSGNVGIGTSSPAFSAGSGLRIERDSTATLRLQDTGAHGFEIRASASAAEFVTANSKPFTFGNLTDEHMRIDSSGNLLVGKTALNIGTVGTEVRSNGQLIVTADADNPADFNRKTSDGTIALFRKDGTTVGSIGTGNSSRFHIGSGDVGLMFAPTEDTVYPWNSGSNAQRDGAIDLGFSSHRFKDLYLSNEVNITGASSPTLRLIDSTNTNTLLAYAQNSTAHVGTYSNHPLVFDTNSTEAARIDTSGNLLVGTTDTTLYNNTGSGNGGIVLANAGSGAGRVDVARDGNCYTANRLATDGNVFEFMKNGGAAVGSISVTSSATAFNTSSDQRLKDNIVDAPSASDDIDAIQVRSFDWKADGSHQKYGMVAQELQTVAPDAVTEGDTEEDMMAVDYSKLVPMMLKEIQSLRARVAQLEGEN